jgi:hypothetical protein
MRAGDDHDASHRDPRKDQQPNQQTHRRRISCQPAQQDDHEGGQDNEPQAQSPMPCPSAISSAPITPTRAMSRGGSGWCILVRSFDEDAVDEDRCTAGQGDEMRFVDRAPAPRSIHAGTLQLSRRPGPVTAVRPGWSGFPVLGTGHYSRIGSRAAYWSPARPGRLRASPLDVSGWVRWTKRRSGLDARHACRPVIGSGYARMLIARAITSAAMTRDTAASVIIISLAHGLIAEMSVGLNAVAVQKPSDR